MTPETFLKEFGVIANAPGGVQRLREMILQLSVMGKLVPQSPQESVDDLITICTESKKKYIEKLELRKTRPVKNVSAKDFPFQIPKNWKWIPLDHICNYIQRGKGPKYDDSSDIKVVSQKCVRWEGFDISQARGVNEKSLEKYNEERFLLVGDLLWNSTGTGTAGRASIYRDTEFIAVADSHVTVIRAPQINGNYLWCYIASPLIQARFNPEHPQKIVSGTTNQIELSTTNVKELPIPLPPLKEQNRIFEKVDQLMALCDRLEAQQQKRATLVKQARISALGELANAQGKEALQTSWKRVQTHLSMLFDHPDDVEDLRKCILQNAVMGKLVPQNPDDEPASELLKKIREDMVATLKNKRRFAKLRKPEAKYYTQMPNGWELLLMEDLLTGSESGWSPKCKNVPRQNDQWGVLKVSAVTWGEYNPNENKSFPSSLEPRLDYEVTSGNFLLSRANTAELVARSVIVPLQSPNQLMLSDKIVRLNFLCEDFKEWVNYVNNSIVSRQYYIENATGTSDSMKNVSRQIIHELPIPFPPLLEQKRIVKKIKSLLILCNQLQKQLAKSTIIAEQLAQSIVETITGQSTVKQEKMEAPKTG